MTWDLTPEEMFNPLLLPPIAMEYPVTDSPSPIPYVVGVPELNYWTGEHGYAGPVSASGRGYDAPVLREQTPSFDRPLVYGRGKMPSAYEADYPQSFFPEVVDSYEAAGMNRQPAGSYNDRMWPGSDVRFDFTFAERQPIQSYPGGISGLGDGTWYESSTGALALGVGAAVLSYFATGAFLRYRARR